MGLTNLRIVQLTNFLMTQFNWSIRKIGKLVNSRINSGPPRQAKRQPESEDGALACPNHGACRWTEIGFTDERGNRRQGHLRALRRLRDEVDRAADQRMCRG